MIGCSGPTILGTAPPSLCKSSLTQFSILCNSRPTKDEVAPPLREGTLLRFSWSPAWMFALRFVDLEPVVDTKLKV